jgi:hypothetical protein
MVVFLTLAVGVGKTTLQIRLLLIAYGEEAVKTLLVHYIFTFVGEIVVLILKRR